MVNLKKIPLERNTLDRQEVENIPVFRSRANRIEAGRLLREKVSRTSHANWDKPDDSRDPISILEASNQGRVQELVPIRYGRMLASPFTFLRGSAALMAYDLATATPKTGIQVHPSSTVKSVFWVNS